MGEVKEMMCCVCEWYKMGIVVMNVIWRDFVKYALRKGDLFVQITLIFCRIWSEQRARCLSGFSVRLFCFVQAKTLCRYG